MRLEIDKSGAIFVITIMIECGECYNCSKHTSEARLINDDVMKSSGVKLL